MSDKLTKVDSDKPAKSFHWLANATGEGLVQWAVIKYGGYAVGLIVSILFSILAYDSGLSWYWLIFMAAAVLYFLVNVVNKVVGWFQKPKNKEAGKDAKADVEVPEGRIKELEQALVEETKKYKSELSQKEGLRKLRDDLEGRWNEHVFRHRWLFNMVAEQEKSISSYVEVKKAYFCYQELQTPMLKSIFGIDFINKSVFDVSIESAVGGHIEFDGTQLTSSPLIIHDPGTVGLGREGTITLEQRLTRPEADLIASRDPKTAEFNLSKLVITINGKPFAESQPLIIPKRLHADPQAEIASLKSDVVVLSKNHVEELEGLKKEQQSVESQLLQRAKIVRVLSEVAGYGNAIEAKCSTSNMEYPKPEIYEWAGYLWDGLRWCFEESYIDEFYSGIDARCPGYEHGTVKLIQVPELNEDRHLWFSYHRKRLSVLINQYLKAAPISRREEG
ncbi:MAG: hypothetical protein ACJ754_26680 [Pyrinomonadaceae bacterium]